MSKAPWEPGRQAGQSASDWAADRMEAALARIADVERRLVDARAYVQAAAFNATSKAARKNYTAALARIDGALTGQLDQSGTIERAILTLAARRAREATKESIGSDSMTVRLDVDGITFETYRDDGRSGYFQVLWVELSAERVEQVVESLRSARMLPKGFTLPEVAP